MRILFTLTCCVQASLCFSQISFTSLGHWQITPNETDSSGVFCRTFYNENRNKYYVVYAARPSLAVGPMQYFSWREYDTQLQFTGSKGILAGHSSAGDYAMEKIGNRYYHITAAPPWNFKLSQYDEDFNLVNSVSFPLDSSDSQADMLFNYTNGRLVIGAFHQAGTLHPSMPVQQASWMPVMHKWEFDTSLVPLGPPVYLNQVFTAWGASCIFSNNQYQVITMYKWPQFLLTVYRYDAGWNFTDSVHLNNDGQWSQGLLWDGNNYFVAYHSGHEHRSGNITLAAYDGNWAWVNDTTITGNAEYVFNSSPPLFTTQHNANRPYLIRVGDTLIVSYDADDYQLTSYTPPIYAEGNRWQANVMKFRLNGLVEIENTSGLASLSFYPNPAKEWIQITTIFAGTLDLLNISGQKILSQEIMEGSSIVPLINVTPGMYFLRICLPNKQLIIKLMVQ